MRCLFESGTVGEERFGSFLCMLDDFGLLITGGWHLCRP